MLALAFRLALLLGVSPSPEPTMGPSLCAVVFIDQIDDGVASVSWGLDEVREVSTEELSGDVREGRWALYCGETAECARDLPQSAAIDALRSTLTAGDAGGVVRL